MIKVGRDNRPALATTEVATVTEIEALTMHHKQIVKFVDACRLEELIDAKIFRRRPRDAIGAGGGPDHPGGTIVRVIDHLIASGRIGVVFVEYHMHAFGAIVRQGDRVVG
jgi:cystathionine beta-lyase family protein involved in aluminum resistance